MSCSRFTAAMRGFDKLLASVAEHLQHRDRIVRTDHVQVPRRATRRWRRGRARSPGRSCGRCCHRAPGRGRTALLEHRAPAALHGQALRQAQDPTPRAPSTAQVRCRQVRANAFNSSDSRRCRWRTCGRPRTFSLRVHDHRGVAPLVRIDPDHHSQPHRETPELVGDGEEGSATSGEANPS